MTANLSASLSMESCTLCVEDLPKGAQVQCPKCEDIFCRKCSKKWIMMNDVAKCPGVCEEIWDDRFLSEKISSSWFLNEFSLRRRQLLLQNELVRLPETEEEVVYKEARKVFIVETEFSPEVLISGNLSKDQASELKRFLKNLTLPENLKNEISKTIQIIESPFNPPSSDADLAVLEDFKRFLTELSKKYFTFENQPLEVENGKPKKYSINCSKENCRGLIVEKKCSVCLGNFCEKCEEVSYEEETHNCKKEILESFEFLSKDTKKCPTCYARIHRIAGCFIMYCVNCRKGFDWGTGKKLIINEFFHNPHYNGQNAQQNPPEDFIERNLHVEVIILFTSPALVSQKIFYNIYELYHSIEHLLRTYNIYLHRGNLDIRILLLLGIFSKAMASNVLVKRYRIKSKLREEIKILSKLRLKIEDLLNEPFQENIDAFSYYEKNLDLFEKALAKYRRDSEKIANFYQLEPAKISNDFTIRQLLNPVRGFEIKTSSRNLNNFLKQNTF